MNRPPRITLEQWRALLAVVDAGGYAQAAEWLHKTQSSISYAIGRIETQLEVRVFEIQGRKAVLTPAGEALTRRARALVDEAGALEQSAQELAGGCETEVRLAADIVFPPAVLFAAFAHLGDQYPNTRIQLLETVLSATDEALLEGRVDLAIAGRVPTGFLGQPLARLRFIAVAHPDHPLHRLGRTLQLDDLRRHRQLVIRDSGLRQRRDSGWLGAEQRWTVSQLSTSIAALAAGHGFAWMPEDHIGAELAAGQLRALPLSEGGERFVQTYLVFADPEYAGPATRRLGELIQAGAATCGRHATT